MGDVEDFLSCRDETVVGVIMSSDAHVTVHKNA